MGRFHKFALLCSSAFLISHQAHAAGLEDDGTAAESTAPKSDAQGGKSPADDIIVSATRVPTPITAIPNTVRVIDREAMDTQLAVSTSLLDSLSFSIPSFAPGRQKMTSTGESLRGRTPLYMVDSIPQSTPLRDGKRSGYTVDPAFVERVEVIYGANAIQGVGATGGVINYVTVAAPQNGDWLNRVTVELSTDDFEDHGFHTKVSGITARKFGAFDFVLGGAYDLRDLYYDGNGRPVGVDTIQGDTMDSKAWSLFAKLGVDLSATQRLEFMANLFDLKGDGDYTGVPGDRDAGVPASSMKGEPAGDPTRNEARNFALTYRNRDLLGGTLTLQGFYYDFYALYGGGTFPNFQDPAIAPVGTLFDQSALSSEKYGAKLTFAREDALWRGLQFVAGVDYLHDETFQELAQTNRLWVPKLIYKGWAPFVQLEQKLIDGKVRVSGGLRREHATLDVPDFSTIAGNTRPAYTLTPVEGGSPSFNKLLKNAGLVVEPAAGLSLFGSYAQGFTMPDAGLILRAVNRPGQSVDDLVDLQPVIADNIELGATYRHEGLTLQASYFWSDSDLGTRIQVIDGVGVLQREKTKIRGLELAASYALPTGLRFGANFAALEGRFDSDRDGVADRDLDGRNISPDRLNVYVESPLIEGLRGRVQMSHLFDRKFEGNDPKFDFNGYGLVDAMLFYDAEKLGRFTLAVSNLFDKQYITYFSQTANFVTNTDYVSGRGRAITLRWQGQF